MTMSHEQSEALLARPLVAVLSTVDAAGNPRTAPVWFHWQDGAAYVFTGRTTLKWRNLPEGVRPSSPRSWNPLRLQGFRGSGVHPSP